MIVVACVRDERSIVLLPMTTRLLAVPDTVLAKGDVPPCPPCVADDPGEVVAPDENDVVVIALVAVAVVVSKGVVDDDAACAVVVVVPGVVVDTAAAAVLLSTTCAVVDVVDWLDVIDVVRGEADVTWTTLVPEVSLMVTTMDVVVRSVVLLVFTEVPMTCRLGKMPSGISSCFRDFLM